MEESQILSSLSSNDSVLIKQAILSLQDILAKNNGTLVIRDLQKLKSSFLSIIQTRDKYDDEEVIVRTFEFLNDFMASNYGSDYQTQFISYVIPEIVQCWLTLKDKQLESAEEALWAYIRSYKQLENVLDILLHKCLKPQEDITDTERICTGINLAIKNIEFHPKIISACSKSFIGLIEWLITLRAKDNIEVSKIANSVITNFLKRFPATIKEIANEMESRENTSLTQLIKLRNDALEQK